jgi:hypothetical protein
MGSRARVGRTSTALVSASRSVRGSFSPIPSLPSNLEDPKAEFGFSRLADLTNSAILG